MTLNVINEMYKRLESSAQNFRSLGGLEVSNSLTGVGTQGVREKGGKEKKRKENKRKKVHWVISRVASQLKIISHTQS